MHDTRDAPGYARGPDIRDVQHGERAGDEQWRGQPPKSHTAEHICNRFRRLRLIWRVAC
jgi:hypothetical protein